MALSPEAEAELEKLLSGRSSSGPRLDSISDKLIDKLNEAVARASKSVINFGKATDLGVEELGALQHAQNAQKASLEGLNKALKEGKISTEDYRRGLRKLKDQFADLEETIGNLDDATSKALKNELEKASKHAKYLEKLEQLKESFSALNVTTKSISGAFAGLNKIGAAAGSAIKGLQGNASGMEIASGIMTAGIDMANGAVQATTGAVGALGGVLVHSTNPYVKGLGVAAAVTAPLIGGLADSASKLAKFGVEVLAKEVDKSIKSFQQATTAGAMFADGVTGLRNAAADSGLTVEQFSGVLKTQSGLIAQSGLGVADGAKQMGRIAKDLKNSGVQTQLLKLGYSFEEQAGLVAETTANMRRSAGGKSSDKEIATETAKYAESLRVIAAITGEDAKQKTEAVRQQNQIMAFQAELAKKTPAQRAAIDAAMATMTEQEKKNFRDRVVLGVLVNKEGAIYEATIAGAREKGERAKALWDQNAMTAEANAKLNGEFGEQIKQSALNNSGMNVAAYVTGGALADVAKSSLDAVNQAIVYEKDAVAAGIKAVDAQKNTVDQATTEFMKVTVAAQELKVALERELTGAIKHFAKVAGEILTSVQDQLKKLGLSSAGEKTDEGSSWFSKHGRDILDYGGTAIGAAIGAGAGTAAAPGIGTVVGGISGGMTGSSLGNALADLLKLPPPEDKGKADGGIASGSPSGFLEKLHGTELVLPLDGKKIDTNSFGYSELMKMLDSSTIGTAGASMTARPERTGAFTAKPVDVNVKITEKEYTGKPIAGMGDAGQAEATSKTLDKVFEPILNLPFKQMATDISNLPFNKMATDMLGMPFNKMATDMLGIPFNKMATDMLGIPFNKMATDISQVPFGKFSGDLSNVSFKELREELLATSKPISTLNDLMFKQAQASDEQTISSKLFANNLSSLSEETRANALRSQSVMNDLERKNFMDMVNFGTVINAEGVKAAAMSQQLAVNVASSYEQFKSTKLTPESVQSEISKAPDMIKASQEVALLGVKVDRTSVIADATRVQPDDTGKIDSILALSEMAGVNKQQQEKTTSVFDTLQRYLQEMMSPSAETTSDEVVEKRTNQQLLTEIKKLTDLITTQNTLAEEANQYRRQLIDVTEDHKRTSERIFNATS